MEKKTIVPALRAPLPLAVAVLGVLLTVLLWLAASQYVHERTLDHFHEETNSIGYAVQQQLYLQSEVLRGMQGFFNGSENVTRDEFERYMAQLALRDRYPAVQAFAFSRRVSGTDRAAYEARLQRELAALGQADFVLQPAGGRDEYLAVEYVYPFDENRAWLGVDLLADPACQPALLRARDGGQLTVSARPFSMAINDMAASYCLVAPVYTPGILPNTPEARQAAFAGMVSLMFRVKEVIEVIPNDQRHEFDIEVYADETAASTRDRASLIYDSAAEMDGRPHELHADAADRRYQARLPLRVGDRDWVMVITALPPFFDFYVIWTLSWLVLGGGLLATLLIYLLAVLLVAERMQAEVQLVASQQAERELRRLNEELESRVEERTRELVLGNLTLAAREEEIRAVLNHLADGVISIDAHGIVRSANPAVERILGYAQADLIGHNVSMLMPEPLHSAHDGYLERYCRTGEAHILGIGREVEGLHRDGALIALELSVSEYFIEGERYFTAILRDIRERKQAERLLEQAKQAAEQGKELAEKGKQALAEQQAKQAAQPSPVAELVESVAKSALRAAGTQMGRQIMCGVLGGLLGGGGSRRTRY